MGVGKIKEFDMNTGNWTLYCGRVDMYFRANAIKDELKLPTLIALVGEEVFELMVNLANPKKPTDLTYDELVKLVREHLQPKPSIMAERYRFRQRRQAADETIVQYLAALKKLAKDCEFKDTLTDNLRDQFVCGVSSDLIRQRLFSEPDLTYAKALSLATALEAAERDAAAVDSTAISGGGATTSAVHALRATVPTAGRGARYGSSARSTRFGSSAGRANSCKACGGQHQIDGCRFKNFVCSSCGNKGHLRRVCPYKDASKQNGGKGAETRSSGGGWSRSQETHHYVRPADNDRSEDSASEAEIEEPMFQMSLGHYTPVSLDVLVNGRKLEMEVDTGTPGSCISRETYESLFSDVKLVKSKYVFLFYDGKSRVKPLGCMTSCIEYNGRKKVLDLFVVDTGVTSLIGRQWLAELGIQIPILQYPNVSHNLKMEPDKHCPGKMLDRYKEVWSGGLGRYTGGCATLKVREGAAPVFHRARPVPYALRERVDAELDAMLRDGVIEPVDCSDWATPLVLVNKSDGGLRLCADFKVTLNPVLLVDRYPLPRIDDLLANLAGGEEFTKIDLSQAYNQICLSEDSKKYCVINTHRGMFRYNRLVYGLSSSSGIFQRIVSSLVENIPNVQCFADDIILTHKDRASHLRSLETLLSKLESVGMKIKLEKCSFLAKEVKYLGYIVDKNGVRPDPEKLRAIKDMPNPTDVSELRSFLGMVNFYARFVPKLSGLLHPLHQLLCKGSRWQWGERHQRVFERVKQLLMSSNVLAHYDPACELVLTCDASAVGIGGVLSQRDVRAGANAEERAVAYVSRKLTKAEQGYAQIHREALAIVYCVKKFHQYLFGRLFRLKTDHKPLVSIFGPQKGIPTMAASRMQRWALILSAYNFKIEYVGTYSNGADILSRLPVTEKCAEEPPEQTYLHFATNAMLLDNETIRRETAKDSILSRVYGYIENGWPTTVEIKQLDPYLARRNELYIEIGCVMWGHRLVVPESCRRSILQELHEPHMGIVKTKAYARSYVWWPGLDEAVEATCRACVTCAVVAPAPPGAPPAPWRWPHSPYERIHLDFLGPIDGQTYLVSIDARSKWIEAFRMSRTTADAAISRLRESWSRWGIPKQVVSDNGPPFTSRQFKTFLEGNGIHQMFSAPYHPASNGAAENAVKIIKNVIKKARRDGVDSDLAIQRYLLIYHNTPHCATGESPAQLLQGRRLRTRLDIIKPDHGRKLRNKEFKAVELSKESRQLSPGDSVWYRNFGTNNKWSTGQVLERLGTNNYSVKSSEGSAAHRHIDQLKRKSSCIFPSESPINTSGVAGAEPATSLEASSLQVAEPSASVEAMEQGSNRASLNSRSAEQGKDPSLNTYVAPPSTDADVPVVDKPCGKRTRKAVPEDEEWNEENGANPPGENPDDEEFDGADDDDESESNERDLEEAVNDGNAEDVEDEVNDRAKTEAYEAEDMADIADVKSESMDSFESEALGSVGSAAGSSWPSSTPEPSPSPASTPSADAADADAEPPFTLGATEHTPYQCQFCDKAFPRLSYLKKHEQTHSDQMPFRCEFCSRLFKHKRSRDRHVKLHTGDRKYRCAHCESAFSRSDHLKIHMKTHDNQKPFQCTVCNRGYNTAAALTSHMQGHKRDREGREPDRRRPMRCLRCGEAFRRPDLLQAHMASAHGADASALTPPRRVASQPPPTLLACMYCTRDTFTTMEQLQLHVRAAHSALLNGEAMSVIDQPAPTDLSRRASDDAPPAKRPRSGSGTPQTTLSPNTFLCNQCDAALPDFEAFRAHLKGHLEEGGELTRTSPAPCVHCGATFADAAASERHLTAHYLAVSCEYTCHSCARSFPTPDDLQKHLLDLHAHHLYRCSLCKEIFDSKVAIQVHFAVAHSGESKVWVCRGCGSGAGALRSEADGVAHVRARHGGARCSCGALLGGPRLRPRAYRCPVPTCSDAFAVQYLLERHMQVHHAMAQQVLNGELTRPKRVENNNGTEADGACSPCTTTEPTIPSEERRRKNGAVALQCAYCGERARSRAELEAHTRAHSGAATARHKCLICDEILPSAAVLAEHKLTHCKVVAGDTCSRCRARLLSEESFLNHMARHHPALPAPCVVCRQTLASEAEARLHARFHLRPNEDEQRCAICLRALPEGEGGEGARACSACYARHATPRPPPAGADHDCRLCRRALGSPTRLQAHLIEHTFAGIGAFTCYLCSAVFTSAAGLQRHLPEHASAPRPYDCGRCGMKFFFRAELDNHAFVHLEEAEIAQRAFYEAYARGAASAWAALAPPEPAHVTTPAPEVKQEPEIKEERNDEYIEVSSPPPPPAPAQQPAAPTPPVVKQEKPDED